MTDNSGLIRELRERLDADERKRAEMLAELRELQNDSGHDAMNAAIRGGRGQPPPEGADGPATINDAIRAAAGRSPEREDR